MHRQFLLLLCRRSDVPLQGSFDEKGLLVLVTSCCGDLESATVVAGLALYRVWGVVVNESSRSYASSSVVQRCKERFWGKGFYFAACYLVEHGESQMPSPFL